MLGLRLEWKRCPDGVEIVERQPPAAAALKNSVLGSVDLSGPVFRHRSDRREPVLLELQNLESPVAIRFLNATTDQDFLAFFSRFGLLSDYPEEPRSFLSERQDNFRNFLEYVSGITSTEKAYSINSGISKVKLTPSVSMQGPGNRPVVSLSPQSLISFMVMEVALAGATGARIAYCEHCGKAFLTGPLTARRSHAKYCSDRCRVYAMRARKVTAT